MKTYILSQFRKYLTSLCHNLYKCECSTCSAIFCQHDFCFIYSKPKGIAHLVLWLVCRDAFPNERIPTLEETVKLCLELGLKMYFDVKGDSPSVRYRFYCFLIIHLNVL